jgi:hypothetical protein
MLGLHAPLCVRNRVHNDCSQLHSSKAQAQRLSLLSLLPLFHHGQVMICFHRDYFELTSVTPAFT